MKKLITLLLTVCMALSLCACGSNSTNEETKKDPAILLPYGMEFGMSYEKAAEAYENAYSYFSFTMPDLEPASANDGYVAFPPLSADFNELFSISEDIICYYPKNMFSFNESKLLYEFYAGATLKTKGDGETVFNCITNYYSKELDQAAIYSESGSELKATIKTNSVVVQVYLTDKGDGSYDILTILHCFDYELGK